MLLWLEEVSGQEPQEWQTEFLQQVSCLEQHPVQHQDLQEVLFPDSVTR